jgi:hypothetical protein
MDLSFLTSIVKVLPLPWIVTVLCNLGWAWIAYKLWQRTNTVMDARVQDSQEYSDRYHEIVDKVNQTLQAILLMKGGK